MKAFLICSCEKHGCLNVNRTIQVCEYGVCVMRWGRERRRGRQAKGERVERRSTVAAKLESVPPPDDCVLARRRLVEAVALAHASALLARGREAARLAVLVNGVDDPVDARVSPDSSVRWVDADNLKVLVDTVLVDPVAVEDSEVAVR